MSSILKALKKLEQEQTTIKPGQVKIDSRILHEKSQQTPSSLRLIAGVVLLLAVGSGTTFFLMKTSSLAPPLASSQLKSPIDHTNHQNENKIDTSVSFTEKQSSNPPPSISTKTRVTAPKQQSKGQLSESSSVIKTPVNSGTKSMVSTPEEPTTPSKILTTNSAPSIVRPKLTVNGIAFQDGGNENLAVINGSTVIKGAIVDGVRVEEILNDRVRFSQNGEKFEIILNKTNR